MTVVELIAAETAAYLRFDAACRASDEDHASAAECDEWDAANDAQAEAFEALISTVPATSAELIATLDRFLERGVQGHFVAASAEQITAVMATVKRFVSGADETRSARSVPHRNGERLLAGIPT